MKYIKPQVPKIKQIIPCNHEIYAVMKDDEGLEYKCRVLMFALCDDDVIYPLHFETELGIASLEETNYVEFYEMEKGEFYSSNNVEFYKLQKDEFYSSNYNEANCKKSGAVMSDDLISKKALVSNLKLFLDRSFLGETTAHDCISVGEIAGLIKDEPTAYDVEKVIEQLEERKKYLLQDFVLANKAEEVKERNMARINEIDGLIEIVKSGGVADE